AHLYLPASTPTCDPYLYEDDHDPTLPVVPSHDDRVLLGAGGAGGGLADVALRRRPHGRVAAGAAGQAAPAVGARVPAAQTGLARPAQDAVRRRLRADRRRQDAVRRLVAQRLSDRARYGQRRREVDVLRRWSGALRAGGVGRAAVPRVG